MSWNDTITSGQISFIESLATKLGKAMMIDETMNRAQASNLIDQLKAEIVTQETAEAVKVEACIPVGYFTVVRDGSHRTFRVRRQALDSQFAPGKVVVALLTGSDNTSSYTGIGFVGEASVTLWKKAQGKGLEEWLDVLLANPSDAGKAYALESGNCFVCNRLLTDPESIEAGIGPVCRESYAFA